MKIVTRQTGGQLPFVEYIPVIQDYYKGKGATTASSSDKNKTENFLEKSILKTLEENALDIDREVFSAYAAELLSNPMGIGGFQGDFTASVSKLIHLRKIANQLKTSKQLYDDAIDHVRTNDTGDDYAMTSDGKVYAIKSEGEGENAKLSLDMIKIEELKDNFKYNVLTNNELLDIRNSGTYRGFIMSDAKKLTFNESVLRDVTSSVGIQDVVESINTMISKFGKRTTTTYPNLSESVAKGMETLYKIKTSSSAAYQDVVENGETKKDLSAAISYIYSNLNRNAKNTLRLNAEMNGTTVGEYLKSAIVFNTDFDYAEDVVKNPGGSGSGSGGKEQLTEESWEHSVFKGHGRPQIVGTTLEGRTRFVFPGIRFDSIKGAEGKDSKPVVSGLEAYNNLQNRGLVATGQSVYFGNIPLDNLSAQGTDLVVDNSAGLMMTYLPVDKSGNPDFSMMQQMSTVQKAIDDARIVDPAKKAEMWEKHGFKYDKTRDTGIPHDRVMKPFLIQNAYTTEATTSFADPFKGASPLSGNMFFEKVDSTVVDKLLQQYNSSAQKGEKLDWNSGWLTDSYKSTVYIPMNDNELQTMISGGDAFIPKTNSNVIRAQQDAVRLTGGYDYNTGSFSTRLKGTSDDDLN